LLETVSHRARIEQLGAPPPTLRVARVHPHHVAGEERRLLATGPGTDLDDHIAVVVGIGGQQEQTQTPPCVLGGRLLGSHLLLGHGDHLGVDFLAGELTGFGRRHARAAPGTAHVDDLTQSRLLLRQPLHPVDVLVGVGCAQIATQLLVAPLEGTQTCFDVVHLMTPGYDARESGVSGISASLRAAASAAMATSIWESLGSRVVSSWVPSTGTRAIRPGSVVRTRASIRMPS